MSVVDEQEQRQVWLAFASAGLASESKLEVQEAAEFACEVADLMLDAYLIRYEPGHVSAFPEEEEPEPPPRKKRKPRR